MEVDLSKRYLTATENTIPPLASTMKQQEALVINADFDFGLRPIYHHYLLS